MTIFFFQGPVPQVQHHDSVDSLSESAGKL